MVAPLFDSAASSGDRLLLCSDEDEGEDEGEVGERVFFLGMKLKAEVGVKLKTDDARIDSRRTVLS